MDGSPASTFGTTLRRAREAAGLSQEMLAERAGLSARGISDLERGLRRQPRLETVRMLADALHLDPNDRAALLAAARSSGPILGDVMRCGQFPVPPTPLLGREAEVQAVTNRLRQPGARLLTLMGPGGVGKTRLALAAAAQLADVFPNGVRFIDLAPITDPMLLLPTVARALGLRDGDGSLADRLIRLLQERRRLLVLDNLEQLLAATPLIANWLASCPELAVLTTSRVRLRLSGEQVYTVPPLGLPGDRDAPEDAAAVRLFVARAQSVDASFPLGPDQMAAIAAICDRLDGLPLAIELAAARVRALPPATLLARLERRLPLLTDGHRDAPDRQRTMRDAIAWSYDLLAASEQTRFRRLAVFVGGCMLEAAETVAGRPDDSAFDPVAGIAALVDTSLLRQQPGADDQPRYLMLETIREYGLEQLAASGEEAAVRAAHADWCLAVAEAADARLRLVADAAILDQLTRELGNLRAALAWLIGRGAAERSLRLAGALWPLWFYRGQASEGRDWLDRALALDEATSTPRAEALFRAAWLAMEQGDLARAIELATTSWRMFDDLSDAAGAARAQWILGSSVWDQGDRPRGETLLTEALATFRRLGDPLWIARGLNDLGVMLRFAGEHDGSEPLFIEALALLRELGATGTSVYTLHNLGEIARARGDSPQAAALLRDSLALATEQGNQRAIASCLEALASIAGACSWGTEAARLFGAAERLLEVIGAPLTPTAQLPYDHAVARVRAATDDASFAAAWAEGRALSLEQALAEAMTIAGRVADVRRGPSPGLTPREVEVLRLVIEGWSNRDIAVALGIRVPTVKRHLTTILGKLELPSRAAAAGYAQAHRLV